MVICPCIISSIWWSSAVAGDLYIGIRFSMCVSKGWHRIGKAGELYAILEEQHSW